MKYYRLIVTVVAVFLLASILAASGCITTPNNSTQTFPSPTPSTPTPTPTWTTVTTASITITSPENASVVDYRTTVKGTSTGVYETPLKIYVVVLPHESEDEYWVQKEVTLLDTGSWSTLAYFGSDATSKDSGKKFTVYAVLSTSTLPVGKMSQKPDGIRGIIELTRK